MFRPIEVRALPRYRLFLRYQGGVEGEVDLSYLVGRGVFGLWDDPGEFDKVTIGSSDQIRWSDQLDLCPDAMYARLSGRTPAQLFSNLRT
ncbi:MAG TPA: DUF2442 domain-containing protein [Pirellulales bacterium]|nr:DUF2442 domain-containing protein [Pirellulales bacterium]